MKNLSFKRLLSMVMVLAMLLSMAVVPVSAVSVTPKQDNNSSVSWERVDNSAVTAKLGTVAPEQDDPVQYAETDSVRVSIVLDKASTIEAGFSTSNIAENASAMAYRKGLQEEQADIASVISKQALGGETLDIVWNLTLAANIISANVKYGDIEAIKNVKGVADVLIENCYSPDVVSKEETADPSSATSAKQIGSAAAYAAGYTGAGSRIAIIDTGIDLDHELFAAGGLEAAYADLAAAAGMDVDAYKASLNLLDADEIAAVFDKLNIAAVLKKNGLTASDLYVSLKVPFGFNYIDEDLDITHDNDTASEHGSHVTGIATANRFVLTENGEYASSLGTVAVQGVAPDAQVITMKVFGKGGGAYDSDYMVAIEDAIILGADSVNLSLGSGNPGNSRNTTAAYQTIMENLVKSDTVVTFSAGNSSYWAENSAVGNLYSDDVSFQMDGAPGSFTNALTVASVDNSGAVGYYFSVNGNPVIYTESLEGNNGNPYTNAPLASIAGEHEYIFIDGIGSEEEFAAIGDVLEGKVALCARGSLSFFQKAENAVKYGAIATIIYNNQPGIIRMDLSDYTQTAPAVTITQTEANMIRENSEAVKAEDGKVLYYTGKLMVSDTITAAQGYEDYYTMSDFSSWGVPGSLELKPEITAPGGNIYNVNGQTPGGKDYEIMSGTSMAAPQVAGMAALAAQYIKANGLDTKTGLTVRALANSLLMSTAEPIIEENNYGTYYSLLRQGAGLANIGNAVSADSYIMMNEDATKTSGTYADGKVKAELGDDPDMTGVYSFSFTVNNLTDKEAVYHLNSDYFYHDFYQGYFDTMTTDFNADDAVYTYYVDGVETDTFTLPANGSVEVKAVADLTNTDEWFMIDLMTEMDVLSGTYVMGYVYVTEETSEEGIAGTEHSIPVLAFAGDWTKASMYDVGSYIEYAHGYEQRPPYLYNIYQNALYENSVTFTDMDDNGTYYFGGNPLITDEVYMPERNAINSEDLFAKFNFTLIRNAAASRFYVKDADGNLLEEALPGAVNAAYYHTNNARWLNYGLSLNLGFTPASLGLQDGDQFEIGLTMAPEYYVDEAGNVDWDALGEGATLSIPVTVDDVAPTIETISLDLINNALNIGVRDNQYVAAIALANASGSKILKAVGAVPATVDVRYDFNGDGKINRADGQLILDYIVGKDVTIRNSYYADFDEDGQITSYDAYLFFEKLANGDFNKSMVQPDTLILTRIPLEGINGSSFLVVVYDYAMNATTYKLDIQIGEPEPLPNMMAFNLITNEWIGFDVNQKLREAEVLASFNGSIFAATDANGVVFAATDEGDLYVYAEDDLTNPTYVTNIGTTLVDMAYDASTETLYALDGNTGMLVSIDKLNGTIHEIAELGIDTNTLANNGNGTFFSVEYGTGHVFSYTLEDLKNGDYTQITEEEIPNNYVQSIEWNPNNNKLYWARYYSRSILGIFTQIFSELYEIDATAGSIELVSDNGTPSFNGELSGLIIPKQANGSDWQRPVDTVGSIAISNEKMTILRGNSAQMIASVLPWTVTDRSVTWTSSDDSIVSVDETGKITGVNKGTAIITATSVLDPSVSASCEVTVEVLDITLQGALMDEEGQSKFFTWNMENDTAPVAQNEIAVNSGMVSAASNGKGAAYIIDGSDSNAVHKVDAVSGEELAVWANSSKAALADLSYSDFFSTEDQDILNAVFYYYYLPAKNPANIDTAAFGFQSYLQRYTGGTEFVAVASGDAVKYTSQGVTYDAETVYLLDDAGYVWELYVYPVEGSYSAGINFIPTNLLDIGYKMTYDDKDNPLSSMVLGEDGNLYFSGFNGKTNVLYRLSYDEAAESYDAICIGNVGNDVWPAMLFNVVSNVETPTETSVVSNADVIFEMEATVLSEAEIANVQKSTKREMTSTANSAVINSEVKNDAEGRRVVTITAKDASGADVASTNGLIKVSYPTDAFKLVSVVGNGQYGAYTQDGNTVTFAYVDTETIAAGDVVLTLTFEKTAAEDDVDLNVVYLEVNDEKPVYVDQPKPCTHAKTEVLNAVDATCTTDGYTGDTHCLICDEMIQGDVIPATGHHYSGGYCEYCGTKDPSYVEPTPVDPTPVDPTPVDPTPVDPTPVDPTPVDPTPVDPTPVTPVVTVESFDDIPAKEDWAYQGIAYVIENGLVAGITDTEFRPNVNMTRAVLVQALFNLEKQPDVKNTDVFDDVAANASYANAIAWASENKIVLGIGDNKFAPEDSLSRAQIAAILRRYAEFKGFDISKSVDLATFADADAVPNWAKTDLAWAAAVGLVKGREYADGSIHIAPDATATRAEVCTIIYRFLNEIK